MVDWSTEACCTRRWSALTRLLHCSARRRSCRPRGSWARACRTWWVGRGSCYSHDGLRAAASYGELVKDLLLLLVHIASWELLSAQVVTRMPQHCHKGW